MVVGLLSNPMNISNDTDGFRIFPYPPNSTGNNGGIDLIKHPERIGEIKELASFPQKKEIVLKLNEPNGRFMTFGCDGDFIDDIFVGYIEFAFRDPTTARQRDSYQGLFDSFEAWVRANPQTAEIADGILANLRPSVSQIHYPDFPNYDGLKLCLDYRAIDRQAAGQSYTGIFFGWLSNTQPAT